MEYRGKAGKKRPSSGYNTNRKTHKTVKKKSALVWSKATVCESRANADGFSNK